MAIDQPSIARTRKPISKKDRFYILMRDRFTCQYCGAGAPAAPLEVDHIVPIAEGGPDEFDNYITACLPCNRGKGTTLLEVRPPSLTSLVLMPEETETRVSVAQAEASLESDVSVVDFLVYDGLAPGRQLSNAQRVSVRLFIKKLGVYPVMAAIETAFENSPHDYPGAFRYFRDICWNQIGEQR
jgi:hypothetical protein